MDTRFATAGFIDYVSPSYRNTVCARNHYNFCLYKKVIKHMINYKDHFNLLLVSRINDNNYSKPSVFVLVGAILLVQSWWGNRSVGFEDVFQANLNQVSWIKAELPGYLVPVFPSRWFNHSSCGSLEWASACSPSGIRLPCAGFRIGDNTTSTNQIWKPVPSAAAASLNGLPLLQPIYCNLDLSNNLGDYRPSLNGIQ